MYIDPLILDRQLVPLPNFTDYIFFSFGTLHSSKKMLHEYVAMAENCTWQSRYAVRTAWRSILEEIHEFFLRRMFGTLFVPSRVDARVCGTYKGAHVEGAMQYLKT
jgi:hypothetical protein